MKRKRTSRRHAVVTLSERELSHGITKLSGSRPFRKVRTAKPYEIVAIIGAARRFRDNRIAANGRRSFKATTLCARNRDAEEKKRNQIADERHAPLISGRLFLIDLKEESSVPRASLVVVVDPTIEPTSPIVSINAG